MNKSVVIIGGGLGGLFTGAILSKEGLKVTVLEKNAIIGGGLQSFRRFGELFDTGMHVIGGMQRDGNIRRICEYLGIWDKVQLKDTDPDHMDSIYFSEDGKTYSIARGRTRYVEVLSQAFPHQREQLKAYVDALYKLANEVDLFYLRPSPDYLQGHSELFHLSATDFIAKYIQDEHLRSVVAYLNPLYGGQAQVTPAYIHALISVLYIDGSSRFAGGTILFAETLRDFIEENGGHVFSGDGVKAVHSEGKLITGVTTESGKDYSADDYICAIHPCSFFSLLDDEKILPKPYRLRLNELPNSYSAFILNIKLKPRTFRYFNYTQYYMSRYDGMWKFGDPEHWPNGFLFLTPPEIGQGEYANKLIVTAPMAWEYVKRWENTSVGKRGADYAQWKAECAEKLLNGLEEMHPGFRDCIEAVNTASPLTIRDFYGVKDGSMYGFSKDCNNLVLSQVPVFTKVPNLFLTGQCCNLHGFCGVTLTAINTCEAILGRNFILDKLNRFDDIRPYYDSEIPQAMHRIARHPALDSVMAYLYPGEDVRTIRRNIDRIVNADEFQVQVMQPAIKKLIQKTCQGFTTEGIDGLDASGSYLFVSNHRDIMLDASLLTYELYLKGFETPEITFGANLMQGQFVIDVGKSNKMFRVERPGSNIRDFYNASEHLSDYIRTTIVQRNRSIWIAQRNGRTKDGLDRTDQAIVKMFAMSGSKDRVKALAQLHIVPVAISYEWEPCDILKAVELYKRAQGPYQKQPGEDLHSIITGVVNQKGRVHMTVCQPLTEEDLYPYEALPSRAFYRAVASILDKRICSAYRLFPNNYIAYDLLHGTRTFGRRYSDEQKQQFEEHLSRILPKNGREEIRRILLGIYANPVDSMLLFAQV